MPRTMLARLLAVAGTMAIGLAVPGVAQSPPDVRFPIILTDAAKLLDAGFALRETFVMRGEFEGDPPASAPHRCNDLWFSVSDAVLARHRQRGFTLETLCLGLWSKDLKFDPETGKRIATFIWISSDDRTDLLGRLKGRDPKAMTAPQVKAIDEDDLILFEQPFRIPDCFRNATPLLDCQWRYDHQSGRPLSAETTKRYRAVGQAIDAGLTRALRGDVRNCKAGDDWPCKPLPPASGRPGTYHVIGAPYFTILRNVDPSLMPDAFERVARRVMAVIAPSLPRRYGYTFDAAEGFGGGGVTNTNYLRYVLGELHTPSQLSNARLRSLTE